MTDINGPLTVTINVFWLVFDHKNNSKHVHVFPKVDSQESPTHFGGWMPSCSWTMSPGAPDGSQVRIPGGPSQAKFMVYNKLITRVNPHLYISLSPWIRLGIVMRLLIHVNSSTAMSCWAENFESWTQETYVGAPWGLNIDDWRPRTRESCSIWYVKSFPLFGIRQQVSRFGTNTRNKKCQAVQLPVLSIHAFSHWLVDE